VEACAAALAVLGMDAAAVLRLVADRVSRCIRKQDTLARMGGDEFTILLP